MNQSILSHEDVRSAMDRALDSENGIRITLKSLGAAINFRQRCYRFRAASQKESRQLYKEGDHQYGRSAYDALIVSAVENFVEIRKTNAGTLVIEEL